MVVFRDVVEHKQSKIEFSDALILKDARSTFPQNSQPFPPCEAIEISASLGKVAKLVWGIGGTYRLHNRTPGLGIVVELTLPVPESISTVAHHAK